MWTTWTSKKTNLNHFQVWGCPSEVKVFHPQEKKLDSIRASRYFVSFPKRSKGYRFYYPTHTTRIVESNNAKFLENHQYSGSCDTRKINYEEVGDVILPYRSGTVVPLDVGIQEVQLQPNEQDVTLDNTIIDTQVEQQPINNETLPRQTVEGDQITNITQPNVSETNIEELRQSTRVKRLAITDDYVVYLEEADIGIKEGPRAFKEAINSDNSDK